MGMMLDMAEDGQLVCREAVQTSLSQALPPQGRDEPWAAHCRSLPPVLEAQETWLFNTVGDVFCCFFFFFSFWLLLLLSWTQVGDSEGLEVPRCLPTAGPSQADAAFISATPQLCFTIVPQPVASLIIVLHPVTPPQPTIIRRRRCIVVF
jgi:hypothetical protein